MVWPLSDIEKEIKLILALHKLEIRAWSQDSEDGD